MWMCEDGFTCMGVRVGGDDVLTGGRGEAVIFGILPSPPRPALDSFPRACLVLVSERLCVQCGGIGFGGRTHHRSCPTGWGEDEWLTGVHGCLTKCGKGPKSGVLL